MGRYCAVVDSMPAKTHSVCVNVERGYAPPLTSVSGGEQIKFFLYGLRGVAAKRLSGAAAASSSLRLMECSCIPRFGVIIRSIILQYILYGRVVDNKFAFH